jgi:hypothetical protein|tara:strand:- start:198 stop:353 length:156 start_codon:yes stop_codon:yes gene_type:complete
MGMIADIHLEWNVSIKDVILALSEAESKGYDIDHFALVQREEWKELKIILK